MQSPLSIPLLGEGPQIDDVRICRADAGPAQRDNPQTGIIGLADLIVRTRDNAHPVPGNRGWQFR